MTPEQTKKFKYWQWRTIFGTMIGYIFFYLIRKNFSFAMPGLTAEYGIDKTTLGVILSVAGFLYGLSKLVNGMLADRINGRWHMVTGLAVCTVTALLFGFGADIASNLAGCNAGVKFTSMFVLVLSVLWIINNIFQGCGFPPCSRLIPRWVPASELSTKMSIWNTSHSIGAGLAGVLCGIVIMGYMGTNMSDNSEWLNRIANNLDKKEVVAAPVSDTTVEDAAAVAPMCSSAAMQSTTVENPEEWLDKWYETRHGEPTSAEEEQEQASFVHKVILKAQHVGAWQWAFLIPGIIAVFGVFITIIILRDTPKSVGLPELEDKGAKADAPEESREEISAFIRKHVYRNPVIWALALADFFVYIIRFAVLDWGPTFLQEARGLTAAQAGWTVVIFEVFGVVGMLAAGWISDKVFSGRATRTCLFCMLGALIAILIFCFLPEGTSPLLLLFVLAFAGMFIYGPQALIGVVASNHATRKASATANGIIGFVSYISVIVSGWGFGVIADSQYGWHGVFVAMIAMAVIGMLIFVPMWKMKRDAYSE